MPYVVYGSVVGMTFNAPRQIILARVFSAYTGIAVQEDSCWAWEKVGNRLQTSLMGHVKRLNKARHGKSAQLRASARQAAEVLMVPFPFERTIKRVRQEVAKSSTDGTDAAVPCVGPKKRRMPDVEIIEEYANKLEILCAASMCVPDTTSRINGSLPLAEAVRQLAEENIKIRQLPMDAEKQKSLRWMAHTKAAETVAEAVRATREADETRRGTDAAAAAIRKEAARVEKKLAFADHQLNATLNLQAQNARLSTQVAAAHLEAARAIKQKEAELKKNEKLLRTVMERLENMRRLKNDACARARSAERLSHRGGEYLKRAQQAEAAVRELTLQYDELHEMYDAANADVVDAACTRSSSDSLIAEHAERDERGRFGTVGHQARVLIMGQLARMTPPRAIPLNLNQAFREFAPSGSFREVSYALVTYIRVELGLVGETLAALQVADAAKVVSFGWDESTKLQIGLLSSNAQIVPGPFCSKYMTNLRPEQKLDVVLRGACVIPGGTAQQVAHALESKLFVRGRRLLSRARDMHDEMHGAGSWHRAGAPNPSSLGTHRLGDNCVLITDKCNAARATRELFATAVKAAIEARIGAEAWAALSNEERASKTRIHMGDCHQHMRNIFLENMAEAASDHLKNDLQDALEAFTAYERMSTDGMQLIRAIYKEMHPTGEYYKGKGREFESWRRANHPSALWVPIENAHGSRQDLSFDGMLPIFANRPILARFLRQMLTPGDASNILEQYLWAVLNSLEMVALIRACTLIDLLISRPLRWLAGKSSELHNWSIYKMGWSMSLVEQVLTRAAADGKVLLDGELSIFAPIEADVPEFKAWQQEQRWNAL